MKTIGIDIGTTSICAVLCSGDEKKTRESLAAQNEFLPESFRQDPERIIRLAKGMLDQLLDQNEKVEGIGISSQMHGILYVDKEGRAVSDFYTWKETCGNECFGQESFASFLSKNTGYPMYTGYGTVTHFALQKRGEIPPEAAAFTGIGDYLAMRLCGIKAPKADPTMAASFGGFCLESGEFDFEKLKGAGVDTSFYPETAAAATEGKEGMAHGSAASATEGKEGMARGSAAWAAEKRPAGSYRNVPVYWAVGDNQASFFAAAGGAEDTVSVNVGTGSQVSLFSRQLTACERGEIRPFVKEGYLYVQASLNGGKVYEKLAAFFEEISAALLGEGADGYAVMQRLGEQKRETDLKIKPSLYGSRRDAAAFGTIENLKESNLHPGDLVRAYVAGMAQELYQLYEEFPKELREGRKRIAASGNGIRKNLLLQQELEKKFGMPLCFGDVREEAAAGAALLAADICAEKNLLSGQENQRASEGGAGL